MSVGSNTVAPSDTDTARVAARRLTTAITDSASLQTAVTAWCSNPASATGTYGHISTWDTSAVTDMSYLFSRYDEDGNDGGAYCSSYDTFNDDISGWDTSRVTSLANTFHTAENFNANLVWEYAAPQPSRRPAAALRGRV